VPKLFTHVDCEEDDGGVEEHVNDEHKLVFYAIYHAIFALNHD